MQPQYIVKDKFGCFIGPFDTAQDAVDWGSDHHAEAGIYVLCPTESAV